MQLLSLRAIRGRNVYAHFPVIRMTVNLGELRDVPSCDIPGFNEMLLRCLPGLEKHGCASGVDGGFLERLERGTYLAHVIEHIAIELQNMMGYNVRFGKARWEGHGSDYFIVFEYENEYAGLKSARLAFDIATGIMNGNMLPVKSIVKEIKDEAASHSPGPSTSAIIREATKRKIPCFFLNNGSLLQLGTGAKQKRIQATLPQHTSCLAVDIASDKECTNNLLTDHFLPVPRGQKVTGSEDAVVAAESIGYPVVVKPLDANHGRGVSLNLRNRTEVENAFSLASEFSEEMLVEKFVEGLQFRVLVVGEKVVAVARRIPAHVTGDGKTTISELIEKENENPLRGNGHDKPLTRIPVDGITHSVLHKNGFTLTSVPSDGEIIFLRENDNLSTGGTAIDVTDSIHPSVAEDCISAAKILGIDVAGIDISTPDISKPLHEVNGAIIEVNAAPGIRMHLYPSEGKPRNVAAAIIDHMFKDPANAVIPIVSVTGTNGKTTTARMINAILKEEGHYVGMTSTEGIYINGRLTEYADNTGLVSVEKVLKNKFVTAAVLETARGGMIRKGLAYDLADIGIITNIAGDHLGLDGITNTDELARAKALVAEAVKSDGYVVLNAADSYCSFMMSRASAPVILFSSDAENLLLQHHLSKDGIAVTVKNNMICICRGKEILPLMNVNYIPATMNGILTHNIENALAAVSAAYGLGIHASSVRNALSAFGTDEDSNRGRFNCYEYKGIKIILDYGHNPHGFRTVLKAIENAADGRITGVLGVPGDRSDDTIRESGRMFSGFFDRIILKEDADLRGRKPGEVPRLLLEGMKHDNNPPLLCEYLADEGEALERAISYAEPGDYIIVFFENFTKVRKVLDKLPERCIPLAAPFTTSGKKEFTENTAYVNSGS